MQSLISHLMRATVWKTKAHLWSERREEIATNFNIPPLICEILSFKRDKKEIREGGNHVKS